MTSPAGYSRFTHRFCERHFRALVPPSSDGGHYLGTLGWREDVRGHNKQESAFEEFAKQVLRAFWTTGHTPWKRSV